MYKDRSEHKIKKQKWTSSIALALILALFIGGSATNWVIKQQMFEFESPMENQLTEGNKPIEENQPIEESIVQHIIKKIEKQKAVDEALQAEVESGSYTIESPLIVPDPYDESPLTALILFETVEPSRIEITILDENGSPNITHTFNNVDTQHSIPVYGLFPGQQNMVAIKQISEKGAVVEENILQIQTEPLPEWVENYIVLTETYQDDYEDGLNYIVQDLKFAFDRDGIPRWFLSDVTRQGIPASLNLTSSHWLICYGSYGEGDVVICEMDLLGKIYKTYFSPYGIHHDLITMQNGNILTTGSRGKTTMDLIVEIEAKTGEILYTLDLKTVLQRTRFGSEQDWAHINSIAWDERDGTIILSSNTQCTVAKLTWPEGEIKWLLSDPIEYMPRLQQYLLTPTGDNFEYSYNQHHATILPDYDNNPDTIDIFLFDNGFTRFVKGISFAKAAMLPEEIMAYDNYSRLVHYRINEKTMTVEQIWQYGKERGEELFSISTGSAQLLTNNNLFGCFNRQNDKTEFGQIMSTNLVEVDYDGNLIWDAEMFSRDERGRVACPYRAFRYPIYFPDDKEHDIYIEAQNLIPPEVLAQNS